MKFRNFRNAAVIGAIGLFSYLFFKNQDRILALTQSQEPTRAGIAPKDYVQQRNDKSQI